MALKKSELYSSLWAGCDELRGGMDASQYKDYVLVLLFVKYVSDKYAGQKDALLDVPKGGRFADMVALKGNKEIGDKMNKIIGKLAEANDLKGVIDVADFNDADKLGKGKEMVDRLSNLVAIFDTPALDFSANRIEGDDLLGDAYEYLMRHFATESGKSKGQFYTPAEVSRVMAQVIGVGSAKSGSQTIYDPTCGSGYIIDYKDLFKSLEGVVHDYTSGALDGYDKQDVAGLLKDHLEKARERLEETLEAVRALCEPVESPKDQQAYFRYFSSKDHGNVEQLKANEHQRLSLYKLVAALIRAYANLASEMSEAGFAPSEAEAIKKEVTFYENLRNEVKLHSGDAIDLKQYEPAMRHLIDTYIRAEESEKVSAFDDLSLVQLIVQRGADAVNALPEGIQKNKEAVAEAIENNVR